MIMMMVMTDDEMEMFLGAVNLTFMVFFLLGVKVMKNEIKILKTCFKIEKKWFENIKKNF
jgi:hypothetical protein